MSSTLLIVCLYIIPVITCLMLTVGNTWSDIKWDRYELDRMGFLNSPRASVGLLVFQILLSFVPAANLIIALLAIIVLLCNVLSYPLHKLFPRKK
jgi:hypothetical protein